jgi:transposase
MKKERQKRNWAGYNLAQTVEAVLFVKLVAKFVDALDEQELWKGIGRPPCPIKDVLKCLLVLEYFNLSSRRAVSMLQLLKEELKIDVVPHFNTLLNYRKKKEVRVMLEFLLHKIHESIAEYDPNLITDSTGKTTTRKKFWRDWKNQSKKSNDFVKEHITFTEKTLMIAEVSMTKSKGRGSGDSSQFVKHATSIRERKVRVENWFADGAYCSRKCCKAAGKAGANPIFRVKKNATPKKKGCKEYREMVKFSKKHPRLYKWKYKRRAKGEAGINSTKVRFSHRVSARKFYKQKTEVLTEAVAYNISRLPYVIFEFGLAPKF